MSNSRLAAATALAAFAFAGAGHAAVVPIEQGLELGDPPGFAVRESAGHRHVVSGSSHHELIAESPSMEHRKAKKGATQPPGRAGGHAPPGLSDQDHPLHAQLMGGGAQPIAIGPRAAKEPVASQVSAVPLPGAIWLLGSALLTFLGISSRRRL
ncbi:MAG TPA: hypothetical protein VLK85_01150 [Ramlibacter sp.]|nr:hypothetical protein [Ramlibacter sp.]